MSKKKTFEKLTPGGGHEVAEPAVGYGLQSEISTLKSQKSPNARTAEEMRAVLTERICRAEAGEEQLIPNEVVFDSIRSKYGFC